MAALEEETCPHSNRDTKPNTIEETMAASTRTTEDTQTLLANLKLRMEQLERHCHFEHPPPVISSPRNGNNHNGNFSVASTVSMSACSTGHTNNNKAQEDYNDDKRDDTQHDDDDAETSSRCDHEVTELSATSPLSAVVTPTKSAPAETASTPVTAPSTPCTPPPQDTTMASASMCSTLHDTSMTSSSETTATLLSTSSAMMEARRSRLARLRQSKRQFENFGSQKLQTFQDSFGRLSEETEQLQTKNQQLQAQQEEWERERARSQQELDETNALLKSLQNAIINNDYSSLSAVNDEDKNDTVDDLTPKEALDRSLQITKQAMKLLEEERQQAEQVNKEYKQRTESLELQVATQRETILELQEEKELAQVKISSLQDMVVQSLQLLQEEDAENVEFVPGAGRRRRQQQQQDRVALQAQAARAILQTTGKQLTHTSQHLGEDIGQQWHKTSQRLQQTGGTIKKAVDDNRGKRVLRASRNLWAMATSANKR